MEIDAVQERAADTLTVFFYLIGRAATFPRGIAEVAAGTRIHRRNETEPTRKGEFARRPRNRDLPVFERLSQDLEGGAAEFG